MNNLQKLIKLRGLSVSAIANKIGYGYHNVQKIIKRATRPTKDGGVVRSNLDIETAVAELLGMTHDECWGNNTEDAIKRLIRQEISAKASEKADQLRQMYL